MAIEEIIEGCKQRNVTAERELYNYCYRDMLRVCLMYNQNPDDAASCYNEAMHKVFKNIRNYEGRGPFMGWVRRIMVTTCLNRLRKEAKYEHKPLEFAEDIHSVDSMMENLNVKYLYEMLYSLPVTHRTVLVLNAVEGYRHKEIAEMLNISVTTSRWYLLDARNKMKVLLQKYSDNQKFIHGPGR